MGFKKKIPPLISRLYGLFCSDELSLGHRVLMYHAVGSPVDHDPLGIFSINPDLFQKHIRWLAGNHLKQVLSFVEGLKDISVPTVSITFDDGYADNLHVAAPLLVEYGLPFTIFVTSDFIQEKRKYFMTPMELREISMLPGVTIGAHGSSHVPLASSDQNIAEAELLNSKKYLEDVTGKPVLTMSYPHGSVNQLVKQAARDFGYAFAASSYFGVNESGFDPFCLKRTEITGQDSLAIFEQKLKGYWDWYRLRQLKLGAA